LADHQPHLSPVERDLLEGQERSAIGNVPLDARLVDPMGGDWHPRLDAALQLDEGQLHVDGRGQLGIGVFQFLELDDLTGFCPGWTLRPILMRLMHLAILVQVAV
jgi:hypothetical protein